MCLKSTQIHYHTVLEVRSPTQVSLAKIKVSAGLHSFPKVLEENQFLGLSFPRSCSHSLAMAPLSTLKTTLHLSGHSSSSESSLLRAHMIRLGPPGYSG